MNVIFKAVETHCRLFKQLFCQTEFLEVFLICKDQQVVYLLDGFYSTIISISGCLSC